MLAEDIESVGLSESLESNVPPGSGQLYIQYALWKEHTGRVLASSAVEVPHIEGGPFPQGVDSLYMVCPIENGRPAAFWQLIADALRSTDRKGAYPQGVDSLYMVYPVEKADRPRSKH